MKQHQTPTPPTRKPKRIEAQARVLGQRELGTEHRLLVLELHDQAAELFASVKAGQFINLLCRDLQETRETTPMLRRPISLAGVNTGFGDYASTLPEPPAGTSHITIDIIYRVAGPGTRWLAHRQRRDPVNIIGPLGNGFTIPPDPQRAILIGGGIGLPPLFFLADQLRQKGYTDILGFAAARTLFHVPAGLPVEHYQDDNPLEPQMIVDQFSRSHTPAILATDDGSLGYHGTVDKAVNAFLEDNPPWNQATIFTCGPHIMLKKIAQLAEHRQMPCQVCMEAYMACGLGLCQSCAVKTKTPGTEQDDSAQQPHCHDYKLVCGQGPVFNARTICWE